MNKYYLKKLVFYFCTFVSSVFVLSACTQPGETTGVGAATGGVVGAGLGSIIGSTTGNAGGGLVVGAMAGSATGAVVGNALQAQDEAIQTQDEAIERQEQLIAAQRNEIDELRRLSHDDVTFDNTASKLRSKLDNNRAGNKLNDPYVAGQVVASRSSGFIENKRKVVSESDLRVDNSGMLDRAVSAHTKTNSLVDNSLANNSLSNNSLDNNSLAQQPQNNSLSVDSISDGSCREAASEVQKAHAASDVSDKLFHFRRALRLCPDDPGYHNGLGEVYPSLNRKVDAEFEFQQALALNPDHADAKRNLEGIR